MNLIKVVIYGEEITLAYHPNYIPYMCEARIKEVETRNDYFKPFPLPEYNCPICSKQLFVKPYFAKSKRKDSNFWVLFGSPMITCEDWSGGCFCPWREPGNNMPWHGWVITYLDNRFPEGEYNESENLIRKKATIQIMDTIRVKYPDVFSKIFGVYSQWAMEKNRILNEVFAPMIEEIISGESDYERKLKAIEILSREMNLKVY